MKSVTLKLLTSHRQNARVEAHHSVLGTRYFPWYLKGSEWHILTETKET